jgi:galactitol-specific phosphotransferase system IIC component
VIVGVNVGVITGVNVGVMTGVNVGIEVTVGINTGGAIELSPHPVKIDIKKIKINIFSYFLR